MYLQGPDFLINKTLVITSTAVEFSGTRQVFIICCIKKKNSLWAHFKISQSQNETGISYFLTAFQGLNIFRIEVSIAAIIVTDAAC